MSQLDRQRARKEALCKLDKLRSEIDRSSASAEEKAFMTQHLAHLWQCADAAMGGEECRP